MFKRRSIFTLMVLLLTVGVWAAPPLTLSDVDGKVHQPLQANGNCATVFFFLAHDCPISNGYAPEMNRICAEYSPKKMGCYMVYTDTGLTVSVQQEHARSFGYRCPALCDPKHLLVKQFGITVTPEVAVVAPDGKLLYRGRIDDTYARVGVRRYQTTERDLRDALNAILEKRPVAHPTTIAVGCYISPVK